MNNQAINSEEETEEHNEYQNFAFHPYNVLLTLVLIGVTGLFLALTGALIYTRVQNGLPPIKLPMIFAVNTVILLGSSWAMMKAKQCYRDDDTKGYQNMLWITVGLSLLFMVMQFVGWQQLFNNNVFINSSTSASYLYVISGLHFAHVIAGLPFLGFFLWTARKRMVEPVSVLVYFSDPEKRLKLRLLTVYWHFLDALWIYLVILFFVNYLIQ